MSQPIDEEGRVPPRLVIVSGAPASGKTTLAKHLASELGLVRLCKDEMREIIADSLPPKTYQESKALGAAAYNVCFRLATEMLAIGVGVVLDAAFSRGMAEPILAPITAQGRTVLIHLAASSQLSSDRFRARFERGERHAAHMDALGVAHPGDLWKDVWWRWELPLDLGVPTLVIDTSSGYVTDLHDILVVHHKIFDK